MKGMRNFHQAFDGGLWTALPRTGFQMFMGGLDPLRRPPRRATPATSA